uniref:Inactive tyrosine-protein kinase PRAG1 n=1 Tax=Sphenodon punctatus TaxID=8508 RepID=A0A8D0HJQ3_SPHPU
MSACSDFVEHLWKPGSCKNCFCPRSVHWLQTSLDLGVSSLNGIEAKSENAPLEDECVITSPYSKPTIAVKPTMINSDASDVWVDGNMNADIPQLSWRAASGKHLLTKPGEAQRTCMDHFSNHVLKKPFVHSAPKDGSSLYPPNYSVLGLHSLESRTERNISYRSMTFMSEGGMQGDRPELPNKGKLSLPYMGICHKSSVLAGTRSVADSTGQPPLRRREVVALPSENSYKPCSPDSESESGEYCSIAEYCTEGLAPQGPTGTEGKGVWHESEIPILSEEESRLLNLGSGFQRESHLYSSVQHHTHSEFKALAHFSEAVTPPGSVLNSSCSSSPLALPQENDYCPLATGESDLINGNHVENSSSSSSTVAEPPLACHVDPPQSEPIYAESTKRKKVQLNNLRGHTRTGVLAHSLVTEQADGPWSDEVHCLSNEKECQDSSTQVAAKITIMAAHTKDDSRTIFLSSPDSDVGVQWQWVSPTSRPDTPNLSPSFGCGESPPANGGIGLNESSQKFHLQTMKKNVANESPAIPPKASKGSPPRGERSHLPSVSSSVVGICDNRGHEGAMDSCPFRPLPSLCSHINRISSEETSRCPAGTCSERRHKYYSVAWNKQCRIEEEEEEEQGALNHTQTREMEKGTASAPSSAGHHHGADCSLQDNKTGMSKSASFELKPCVFYRRPPQSAHLLYSLSRHFLKMNKSNSELEKASTDSAESLSQSFREIQVSFTAGSIDSLNFDTNTLSNGGDSCKPSHSPTLPEKQNFPSAPFPVVSSKDRPHCALPQPPPLPQKKTVSRTVSSPDGFFWGPASPSRTTNPTSPRLNISHSESNVCVRKESLFGSSANLGNNHRTFSSSESLEKAFKGTGHWASAPSKRYVACAPNKNGQSFSSSQLSVSSQVSSGSSLQLHNLLSNIDSKEGVYAKLGGLYAESLRRLVAKCEDCFMRDQKSELRFNENNWSLFKLTCNKPCCNSGDAIYYCATCSKDPTSTYAVKICKMPDSKASASYCSPSVPVHFNVQQDCGHFVASVPSSMLLLSDALRNASPDGLCPSRSAGERDCIVVITREVPHQTAADFVREAAAFHKTKPELYERRSCFLLLQLCSGLEHLKEYSIIHRDLCLENLLLVHCKPSTSCGKTKEDKSLPRLIISNFLKAKQKPGTVDSKVKKNQARLAPEIVSASQYKKFDEFQTGILIYELLHQANPFEVRTHLREQEYSQDDLPPIPNLSIYSRGLQQLAHSLLEADPIKRIRITEAKRMLQCLLWGPRKDLTDQPLNHEEALHNALQNWIDMKRALLMMKFAERAVDTERSVELEDWLCCQYLASAAPASLINTLKLLQLL